MNTASNDQTHSEYNAIGKQFKIYEGKPGHIVQTRTLLNLAGNATNKSVLDLACGYGYFGRELHKRGASRVVGVDLSEAMIEFGKEESRRNGDNIDFRIGNVSELGKIGDFDIVIASFLFNYADSLSELKNMFQTAAQNLKPNGKLVAYTVDPDYIFEKGNFTQYGVTILDETPYQEGHQMRAEFIPNSPTPFTFYRWKRQDYDRIIKESGFSQLHWQKPMLLKSDISNYPQGFWDIYQNNGFHTALLCQR